MTRRSTENMIMMECRKFCETFRLDQVYLTEAVGPRRHYLGGYGHPSADKANRLRLSDRIVLFWHGSLPREAGDLCKRYFLNLTDRLERELSSPEETECDNPSCPKRKET